MLYKSNFVSRSLLAFSFLSPLSLKAFHFGELDTQISSDYKRKISIIDHKEDFQFHPYSRNLSESGLEVSALKFSKKEFAESPMKIYDIDGIHNNIDDNKNEFISLVKTYYLYPNKTPDFFSLDTINSDGYCKAAFDDKKRVRQNEVTVYSENERFFQKINVTVHFMSFDVKKNILKGGSPEKLAMVLKFAPLGTENLERVISTYSSEEDISFGSRGARTTNYYYNIGGKHTLHSSIKVLSFKKESLYDSGPAKAVKAWDQVQSKALENQKKGTKDSLQRLTKYIYKKQQKENEKKKKNKHRK